ncbi:MucB/RseB C-terminal domain-containing protein [Limnobacter humi]|uniref:MucB/RseB C-terminal domain-containing protein n=1 Tax=Limnobacter humi TaxID=1778671 RepID=A0ABT1WEI6_9BURK|nr:MucB/RseB C-terminal domain-containing protein [Limnobacter humi]MCQ8895930.1 MucB/RseB C-terminal domain-containing protein [Limnobacter humi]
MSWLLTMHHRRYLSVFLLLVVGLGGLWPFPSRADNNARELWALLDNSHEQARALTYSGLLLTQSGEFTQASKLLHQSGQSGEFEVLERLDGPSAKWVRHNEDIQCILPDKKLVLSEKRQTSVAFPRLLSNPDGTSMLVKLYDIREAAAKRVAGRSTRVIQLTPKDDLRYGYRFYLDRQRNLLLRSELFSSKGEVLEHVGFTEINFDADQVIKPEMPQAGPGWKVTSTEIKVLKDGELSYSLPDIFVGFKRSDTLCRIRGKESQIHQTLYTDGLSSVSVFIQKANDGHSMPQAPISHGAVMSRSEVQGQHLVTVLGEVPEKTLGLFLKSVRWKSQ